MKPSSRTLLLEGVMVVASVLLALAVDSWWEGRQEQARADAAMEEIRQEATANLRELESSLDRIQERRQALIALEPRLGQHETFYSALPEFRGFVTPDLQDATWQRIIRQPYMGRLPHEFVEDAFYLYDWHFDLLEEELLSFVLSDLVHTPGRTTVAYSVAKAAALEDVRFVEDLLNRHRAFLERHFEATGAVAGGDAAAGD